SISQISGVAQPGYNVRLTGEFIVYSPHPKACIRKECSDMLHAFFTGNRTYDVQMLDFIGCKQVAANKYHTPAGGQHRVRHNHRSPVQVWGALVLFVYFELATFLCFPIGRNKGIVGSVEDIKQSLMQRQTRTDDGCQNRSVRQQLSLCFSERSLYKCVAVSEMLGNFIAKDFTDTLQIPAKPHAIGLDIHVS